MANEQKKNYRQWKNQVRATLSPKYQHLVKSYADINGMAISEVVGTAVRTYFDKLPDQDRHRVIAHGKNHY
jgi:hypothetical protein